MAARGRGRGGAGRGRGGVMSRLSDEFKSIDPSAIQPPPLYPPLPFKPVPLKLGPEYHNRIKSLISASTPATRFHFFHEDLVVGWKFQLQHLFNEKKETDIDRYSDRYDDIPKTPQQSPDIDFNRIPKELRPTRKRKAKAVALEAEKKRRLEEKSLTLPNFEELEKRAEGEADDENVDEEEKKKKQEGEEEEEEEEVAYESEYEEDDYNENYFDNGERYGDNSDGSGGEAFY